MDYAALTAALLAAVTAIIQVLKLLGVVKTTTESAPPATTLPPATPAPLPVTVVPAPVPEPSRLDRLIDLAEKLAPAVIVALTPKGEKPQ